MKAGDKTPWLNLFQICREMRIPVRVEASRGSGSGYLELEDRYAQLLREWVGLQGYGLVEAI